MLGRVKFGRPHNKIFVIAKIFLFSPNQEPTIIVYKQGTKHYLGNIRNKNLDKTQSFSGLLLTSRGSSIMVQTAAKEDSAILGRCSERLVSCDVFDAATLVPCFLTYNYTNP